MANVVASFEYFDYRPPNTANLNDDNGDFTITVHNEDLVTHPRKTFLELRGKVIVTHTVANTTNTSTVTEGSTTTKTLDVIDSKHLKIATCGWLHMFDRIDYYIGDNKIDTVRKPGIVSLMKGLASFQSDKQYNDAGWNFDCQESDNTLKSNGNFQVMIPLSIVMGFFEDHKSYVYNMCQKMVFYKSANCANNIFQLTGDYVNHKVNIDLRDVILKVPHVKFDLEHTTKVRNEIARNCKYELRYRRWFYNHITPASGSDFTWDIPVSYAKTKFILIAFQTNRLNKETADASQFDLCNLENCQVLLNNNIYYPHEPLNLNVNEHRCGALYNMFRRFKGSYYSKDDERLQPIVSYSSFLTKYPLIVIDCSHQPSVLKESLINLKIFFGWRSNLPANTIVHAVMIVDDKAIYSPLTNNVFHG
ncbi:hypothetical protein V9T40_006557 [Parthenolecanium corni]|uniref:Double jelly roll-like domain-containing protein n=1 Tax=Parthenolecanium corni TaxID=536013 RepID=A0AAN9Y6G5_9HEMI